MVYKKSRYAVLLCAVLLLSGCSASGATASAAPPSEPAMTDYLTYKLPEGLSDGAYTADIGNKGGNLFIADKAKTEDAPNAPQEWLAAGGVMFYDRSLIAFKNGEILSVESLWNHSEFLTAPERVPNGEANAVIALAVHDLYTAAEIESAKAAGNPIPEEKQTVKMWYAFFAKEAGDSAYALFLNAQYFSKDDLIKLAQSVHFTDGAFRTVQ
jgi:hypothetical protein